MQKRRVVLSTDAVLWHADDPAWTFAVVESGKLGIRTEQGLVGIAGRGMVVGESALLTLTGGKPKRTATVFAIEDDTTVVEYPPVRAKQATDEAGHAVWRAILSTLLGQVLRNCLLLVSARKENPLFSDPFRALMQSLALNWKGQVETLESWGDFSTTFRFLYEAREFTEVTLLILVPAGSDREMIARASVLAQEVLKGHGDLPPLLTQLLDAEQERNDWLER
jgi:CRP-like cAMP-binding protein